jgi:hypothetical protein
MANSLGTLSSGVVLARALELVFTKRPILNQISLDLSTDEAKLNSTVKSRIHSVPAVGDFPSAATAKTDTDVAVTIDKAKQVRHTFTNAELSSTDRNLVQEAAEPVAVAIANHMVDALAALWVKTNFPNERVQAVADTDYETLTGLRGDLTGRGAPDERFVAVNGPVYTNLLNDPLCNRAAKQNGADPIADGRLQNIAGFREIFEYPALPDGPSDNVIGFAGSKDSLVIATRLPADPSKVLPNAAVPGSIGVITEPRTGLSIMVAEWINMADLSAEIMAVWLYGAAKGNPNNGQLLVSTASP